jgi:hypothetical protein
LHKQKDTEDKWLTYEAILQDCHFEYPSPFPDEPMEEVEQACRKYLDEFTNGYRMEKFYLKHRGVHTK